MQETITEADIHDFLDKLKLFVPNLGEYEYHSSENFQYLIKTFNHSIKIPMEQLIANRNKQLTQEHFKVIADGLVKKDASTNSTTTEAPKQASPNPKVVFEKRVDAGYKIFRILLILFLIGAALVGGIIALQNYSGNRNTGYGGDESEVYEDPEVAYPENYLNVEGNWKFNWLQELKLTGTISNSASKTTYKDITITIQGKAKTGTVLEERNYTIHEFVPPNSSIPFELHTKESWDNEVVSIGIDASGALVQ